MNEILDITIGNTWSKTMVSQGMISSEPAIIEFSLGLSIDMGEAIRNPSKTSKNLNRK